MEKIQVSLNSDNNNGTLHEDVCTFMTVSRRILLRMRNVADKICRGNQSTHFAFSDFFFFENRAVYEIMWKNIVERGRTQITIWRIRTACWIPKATNTHSQYVILIAFPLQWLHEHASMLRYTWSVCTVFAIFSLFSFLKEKKNSVLMITTLCVCVRINFHVAF